MGQTQLSSKGQTSLSSATMNPWHCDNTGFIEDWIDKLEFDKENIFEMLM